MVRGEVQKAQLISRIALQPQFKWFGRWNESARGGTTGAISLYLRRVALQSPGSVPQIVVMRHQGRACHGRYTAGGAAEDERTRQWYRDLAAGIGRLGCHPLKRGLGSAPTTKTHDPRLDGYFYIGRPGYSGGSCNGGPLPVGAWFEERALMFARYATNWLRPPRGHRFGLPRPVSLKSVAGDQMIE